MTESPYATLSLLFHWLSLWLGLYLLSRRPRTDVNLLAGGAIVCMSAYLLCIVLIVTATSLADAVLWTRVLGGWSSFAAVLFMHAMMALTGWRPPYRRALLVVAYAGGVILFALGFSDTLFYDYWAFSSLSTVESGGFRVGPLYVLGALGLALPLAIAVVVLLRARPAQRERGRSVARQYDVLIAGTAVMLAGSCLLLANAAAGVPLPESLLQPVLLTGSVLVVLPLALYGGQFEGQVLRLDLKASALGALIVMAGFVVLFELAGQSIHFAALAGWFLLAAFVFGDELRALADRAFFGAGSRAGRAGLRTAVRYSGALEALDLSAISPEQYATVIELLGEVDRAETASVRLGGPGDPRLALLAGDEFASVRAALGLPSEWGPEDALPRDSVRRQVTNALRPRERQALGLRYLGYSDKQMAQLMGVKKGVPRSYLSEAKRKLGLSAGASLMLFVHFSGLVEHDAMPLLAPSAAEERPAPSGASSGLDTESPPAPPGAERPA